MLKLGREIDYSLLAMMYIAARPAGQLAYRRDIAAHYNIPKEFLAKVLQKLTRHGLIDSFRGMQGGYRLARAIDVISLADVIEAVEGPLALVDCQCEPYDCGQESACTVKTTMRDLRLEILGVLGRVSLGDMRRRLKSEEPARLIALEASPK